MKKIINKYSWLVKYSQERISSLVSLYPHDETNTINNEVLLKFADGNELLLYTDYAEVDDIYSKTEDTIFDIREVTDYQSYSNIADMQLANILINEVPEEFSILYDEIYLDGRLCLTPLLGMKIITANRKLLITRDMVTGFFLNADFEEGNYGIVFSLEKRWGEYDTNQRISAKRLQYDFVQNKEIIISEYKKN